MSKNKKNIAKEVLEESSKKNVAKEVLQENSKKNNTKVTWMNKSIKLIEIYQSGLEMCFISKELEQSTQFVLCKDFLHDAIAAQIHKKDINIYNFKFSEKNKPIDLETTRICVVNSKDKDLSSKVKNCAKFLNQIESELGLKPTKILKISNPPAKYKKNGAYIFESSGKWLIAPPMISLYTLFIRVGMQHKPTWSWRRTIQELIHNAKDVDRYDDDYFDDDYEVAGSEDAGYLKQSLASIDKIFKYGYTEIFHKKLEDNYPNVEAEYLHDSFGIVGFTNKDCKHDMPHWYRNLKKAKLKSLSLGLN